MQALWPTVPLKQASLLPRCKTSHPSSPMPIPNAHSMHQLSICIKHNFKDDMALPRLCLPRYKTSHPLSQMPISSAHSMCQRSICIKHNFGDDIALPASLVLFVHGGQYISVIALAYSCNTLFCSLPFSFSTAILWICGSLESCC